MHEIRRIDPARAARVLTMLYGAMFGLLTIFMLPTLFITPSGPQQEAAPPKAFFLAMIIIYPLVGAAMGWVTGQLGSRIYNWVARRRGGLLVEVSPVQSDASAS